MAEPIRDPWTPLRCSYPDSKKVNAVSFEAETLFTRLIARSDDGANFDGDSSLILCKLFAERKKNGQVSERKIKKWVKELVEIGLIVKFRHENEIYIHIKKCKKHLRKDIKQDIRFPPYAHEKAVFDDSARNGRVTDTLQDPERARNGRGPLYSTTTTTTTTYPERVTDTSHTEQPSPQGSATETVTNESSSVKKKKSAIAKKALLAQFDKFWESYPRKIGKGAARSKWLKIKPSPELTEDIIAAVKKQCGSQQWQSEHGQFIPNPSTWLNQERWLDECASQSPSMGDVFDGVEQTKREARERNRPYLRAKVESGKPVSAKDLRLFAGEDWADQALEELDNPKKSEKSGFSLQGAWLSP